MIGWVKFQGTDGRPVYVRSDEMAAEAEDGVAIVVRGTSEYMMIEGSLDDVMTKIADALQTIPDLYGPAGTEIRRPG